MIRRTLPVNVAFLVVYATFWVAQGHIDQASLYSLLILLAVVLSVGAISSVFRRRASSPQRRPVVIRSRHRMWVNHSVAFDDSDIERLRREWQVSIYDPGFETRRMPLRSWMDDSDHPVINPATGLTMIGGIGGLDASGHSYGTGIANDTLNGWHQHDGMTCRQDDGAGRCFDDSSHFSSWDR